MSSAVLGRPDRPMYASETRAWTTELSRVALPFLADHRLRDVAVLPGAVCVEMALAALVAEGLDAGRLGEVRFHQMCLVPVAGSTRLRTALLSGSDGGLTVRVSAVPGSAGAPGRVPTPVYATLGGATSGALPTFEIPVAESVSAVYHAGVAVQRAAFYTELRAGGNDYGPTFRTLDHIRRLGDEACALVRGGSMVRQDLPGRPAHPVLLDAAVQLVAAAAGLAGRPFVWAGCARIRVRSALPPDVQAYARAHPPAESGERVGDAVLLTHSGEVVAELSGVRLRLLHTPPTRRREEGAQPPQRRPELVVASTFPAEPLRAELESWASRLQTPVRVTLDPRVGPVAELTGPSGTAASNPAGVNLLLVGMDEECEDSEVKKLFHLPGIGPITHLHDYETEYLHEEIFVKEAYLRHGVTLRPGDCVLDVGANIGMFTLFVSMRVPGIRVYAFEPARAAFEVLRENVARYCPDSQVFNYGISDDDRVKPFTYYPNSTVFSGFLADVERDERTIRTIIRNAVRATLSSSVLNMDPIVNRLARDRLRAEVRPVATRTLSSVLTDVGIGRVDLLKIDTEGSELRILKGVEDRHWERVRQVVLEIHGRVAERDEVVALLERQGFRVTIDQQEDLLRGTDLITVFGKRPDDRSACIPQREGAQELAGPVARRTADVVEAVAMLRRRTNARCVVCLCPALSATPTKNERLRADRADRELTAALASFSGVVVVTRKEVDKARRALGLKPGKPSGEADQRGYFAALATVAARACFGERLTD